MDIAQVVAMAKAGRIIGIEGGKALAVEVERLTNENELLRQCDTSARDLLKLEVERLTAEVAEFKGSCEIWMKMNDRIEDELRTVRTERDRYKAAMETERERCADIAYDRLMTMGYQLRAGDVRDAILAEQV